VSHKDLRNITTPHSLTSRYTSVLEHACNGDSGREITSWFIVGFGQKVIKSG